MTTERAEQGGPGGRRLAQGNGDVEVVSFEESANPIADMDLYAMRRFQHLVEMQEQVAIPLSLIRVTNVSATPAQVELMRRSGFLPADFTSEEEIQLPLAFAIFADTLYINGRTWRQLDETQRESIIHGHILPAVRERLGASEDYPTPVFVLGPEVH